MRNIHKELFDFIPRQQCALKTKVENIRGKYNIEIRLLINISVLSHPSDSEVIQHSIYPYVKVNEKHPLTFDTEGFRSKICFRLWVHITSKRVIVIAIKHTAQPCRYLNLIDDGFITAVPIIIIKNVEYSCKNIVV